MEISTKCIAPEVLKEKLKSENTIIIIDVRSFDEYTEKHIPAAVNIPLPLLEKETMHFNKEIFYVTACGKGGGRSAEASEIIVKSGYVSTWLCNGTFGWFE